MTARAAGFPAWMKKAISSIDETEVSEILRDCRLNTVCREASCPNRQECFRRGTATFLIMGKVCTRNCRFCDIGYGKPEPLEIDEPARIAAAAVRMGLKYVVVTSVTRDDLPDGGSGHFARVIRALKEGGVNAVEVLTSDFGGREESIREVLAAGPDVFNHNVETIPRLYPDVRPQADYARSLAVLRSASRRGTITKSGIMVGLGEMPEEVITVLRDLAWNGVKVLTIGQYLSPSALHSPVLEFVSPARFEWYEQKAYELGFSAVKSGSYVRSSYHAESVFEQARKER